MRLTLIALLCVLVAALAFHALFTYDVWTHLAAGRYIVENHAVPQIDPFSYTLADKSWVDHEWLFQVVLYGVYRMGGVGALGALRLVLALATFVTLLAVVEKRKTHLFAVLILLAAVMSSYTRFQMRPELVSMLFFAAMLAILTRVARNPDTRLIFLLPAIQLLWVNVHGLFIIGPLTVLIFIAGRWFSTNRRRGRCALILGLMIAACFVNPYFHRGAFYPLTVAAQLVRSSTGFAMIGELVPTLSLINVAQTWWFKALTALTLLSFVVNFRRTRFWRALLVGLTWPFALIAARNTPVFAIAGALCATLNFAEWWEANQKNILTRFGSARQKSTARVAIQLLLAALMVWLICDVVTNRMHIRDRTGLRFGCGMSRAKFSEDAMEFVRENNLQGPLFNNLAVGGMCMFHLYPQHKVFIDGRAELYGNEMLQLYRSVMLSPERFRQLARKHGFNTAIFTKGSYDAADLSAALYKNPDWQLVFMDSACWVFARKIPEHRELVKRAERRGDVRGWNPLKYDRRERLHKLESKLIDIDWLRRLGYLSAAESQIHWLSEWNSDVPDVHFTRAIICQSQGYRLMTKEIPKLVGAKKAAALKRMNEYFRETEEAYDRVARMQPNFPGLHFSMATFYANTGRTELARNSLAHALRVEYHSASFLRQASAFAQNRLNDSAWAEKLSRKANRRRR